MNLKKKKQYVIYYTCTLMNPFLPLQAAALKKPGMVDTFRLTVKHEGVRALYKGLVPNSLKVGRRFLLT